MTVCYDPLTNKTVTVSGACPGSTFPLVPGMTPPPQGTETPTQATPGGNVQQAAGNAVGSVLPNINVNVPNPLSSLDNSWLVKLFQDPATYKQIGLVAAGLVLVLIGVPLLFLGGRNRQPTEVITNG